MHKTCKRFNWGRREPKKKKESKKKVKENELYLPVLLQRSSLPEQEAA